MESPSPSLGDKIAHLRGSVQVQESCAWIPASLHALIIACLVHIFGHLEDLVRLWQAGALVVPAPSNTPRAGGQSVRAAAASRRNSRARRTALPPQSSACATAKAARQPPPSAPPGAPPRRVTTALPRRHQARDPPALVLPKLRPERHQGGRTTATISLRNRNKISSRRLKPASNAGASTHVAAIAVTAPFSKLSCSDRFGPASG